MIKGKILISMMMLVFNAITTLSYGFEVNVHRAITKNAGTNVSFLLDGKIKDAGLFNGIKEKFNGKDIIELLQDGSQKEDEPIYALRYLKHFYEPISGSGLYGTILSSYQWANDGGNEWSWRAARNRYYTGLTATTDTERRLALADSFRSIGQVTHLLQDLASVAHVRNDAHGIYDGFEAYTKDNVDALNYSSTNFANALTSVSPYAPKQFWDSETYDGTNPSASLSIGLAEYTNANFFSGDTIFTFPYPSWSNVVEYPEIIDVNTGKTRTYLRKLGDGQADGDKIGYGDPIEHIAAGRWFYKYLPSSLKEFGLTLNDNNVYNDYAQKLIPRAVGYSAGLLNYFFRGQIDMAPDPNSPGNYIIENYGNEAINANDGVFTLYYDGTDDQRHQINWTYPSDGRISVPAANANGPGKSTSVSFTAPAPTEAKEPGKYILVYRGKLGNENDAIVGKLIELNETIYVTDARQDKVFKYSGKGGDLRLINSVDIDTPMGVYAYNDRVYVTSRYSAKVYVLDINLNILSSFGSYGQGHGQFQYPWGITANSENIYVCDETNRLQIFDRETFAWKAEFSPGDSIFSYLYGVVVDADYIYVTLADYYGELIKRLWYYDINTLSFSGMVDTTNEIYYFDGLSAIDDTYIYSADMGVQYSGPLSQDKKTRCI